MTRERAAYPYCFIGDFKPMPPYNRFVKGFAVQVLPYYLGGLAALAVAAYIYSNNDR